MRVKICGITSVADGIEAAALGADAIGLNFYDQSPRHIDARAAECIVRALPPFVEPVGLFVNRPLREIVQTVNLLGRMRTIQWYGEKREVDNPDRLQIIAAFPVRAKADLEGINQYLDSCRRAGQLPAAVLVDARVEGQYGGTGQTVPWELLADFRPGVPLILAGGLTPDNVAQAVRLVRPYAVDVASGVECSPGRKDTEKMRRFIDNAREAAVLYA